MSHSSLMWARVFAEFSVSEAEKPLRSFRRVAIAIKQPIPLRRYVPSQDLTATEAAGKGLSVQKVARVCLRQRGTSPEKGAEMLAWTDIRKTGWDE